MPRQSGNSLKTDVLQVLTQQPDYSILWFCCLNIWSLWLQLQKRTLEDGTSASKSSAVCHFYSQLTQQNWSHGPTQLQVRNKWLYSLQNKEVMMRTWSSVGRHVGVHIVRWSIIQAKAGETYRGQSVYTSLISHGKDCGLFQSSHNWMI